MTRRIFSEDSVLFLKKLEEHLSAELALTGSPYDSLLTAMRYSVLNGGKRVRASLLYLSGQIFSLPEEMLLDYAAALEMVHAYSLIHDDLPAMDDDDMRRGKPANHIAFGEAMAILAGDALLNRAMEILIRRCADGLAARSAASYFAEASGFSGMIGGQVIDLEATGIAEDSKSEALLLKMIDLKTAALFRVALVLPCILAEVSSEIRFCFEQIAVLLGRSFQFQDDLLDIDADARILGKNTGKDLRDGKFTALDFYGKKNLIELLLCYQEEIQEKMAYLIQKGFDCGLLNAFVKKIFARSY